MQLKLAVEMDQWAADTIYLNHPEAPRGVVALHDVTKLADNATELARYHHVDVVAGGPPCQPFSMARRHSGADRVDSRRYLFRAFLEVAAKVEPRVVIMENVPGMLNAAGGRILKALEAEFAEAGFLLGHKLLSASSYGVPQNRSRVFFIGVHKKRNLEPAKLLETILSSLDHGKHHGPGVTSAQALSGVPRNPANGGGLVVRRTSRGRRTRYARTLQRPGRILYNHETRPHNPRDIQIFDELGWGETARELEARKPNTIPYQLDSFGDKYRRLHPNKPAPTIPAHLRRDANSFVHPFVPRGITPREAARFQSFPDDYVFLGGQGPSFVQIGNAVPPLLAKAVGSAVVQALRESAPAR
jgi:DNA (cytosine-5)-methyltransferase 1